VKFSLFLKVDLENVTNFGPVPDMRWFVKFKCSNCGEETDKWTYVTAEERVPLKGGRGEANLAVKCKGCKRENNIELEGGKRISANDSANWVPVILFECRGVEITAYEPRMGFTCEAVNSGTSFDVDLSEGDWSEYDDKASQSIGIYNVEHKIEKSRN